MQHRRVPGELEENPMTRAEMLHHGEEWIAAWNRRDVDAVLEHFAEDAVFVSPRAAAMTGSAVVRGKAALRTHWQLPAVRLEFVLDRVICDPERREMVVIYDRIAEGTRTRGCEIMRFDQTGRQIAGEALFGAAF